MTVSLRFFKNGVCDGNQGAWFRGLGLGETRWTKKFFSYAVIEACLNAKKGNAKKAAATPDGRWICPDSDKVLLKGRVDWEVLTMDFRIALEDRDNRRAIAENRARKKGDILFSERQRRTMMFCFAFMDAASGERKARFSNGEIIDDLTDQQIDAMGGDALTELAQKFNPVSIEDGDGMLYPVPELMRGLARVQLLEASTCVRQP